MYLATPIQVAKRLKETAKGRGDSILHESWTWTARSKAAGITEKLSPSWTFSKERIEELLTDPQAGIVLQTRI